MPATAEPACRLAPAHSAWLAGETWAGRRSDAGRRRLVRAALAPAWFTGRAAQTRALLLVISCRPTYAGSL